MFTTYLIGSRGGLGSLPNWTLFQRDMRLVAFDADPEASMDIAAKSEWGDTQLHCFGVGSSDEKKQFFVTAAPTMSSFLRGSSLASRYGTHLGQSDYDYKSGLEVELVLNVQQRSIDSLVESGVAAPNWLAIDVQGYENQVLSGAMRALKESVVGLNVEVQLTELYEGASLFSDVHKQLTRLGFELIGFQPQRSSFIESRLGSRGVQAILAADATYILADVSHKRGDLLLSCYQAFGALAVGATDLGLEIMDTVSTTDALPPSLGTLGVFLEEARSQLLHFARIFPPNWHDVTRNRETPMHYKRWRADNSPLMKADSQALEGFLRKWSLHGAAESVRQYRTEFFQQIPAELFLR